MAGNPPPPPGVAAEGYLQFRFPVPTARRLGSLMADVCSWRVLTDEERGDVVHLMLEIRNRLRERGEETPDICDEQESTPSRNGHQAEERQHGMPGVPQAQDPH